MKTIYKYPLELLQHQYIELPVGAQPLCVQLQNGRPCLWALVDNHQPIDQRQVVMYGTGHPTHREASGENYIGTIQLEGGALVFHFFLF